MAERTAAMPSKPTMRTLPELPGRLDRGQGPERHAVVAAEQGLDPRVLAQHRRGDPVGLVHLPLRGLRVDDRRARGLHRVLEPQLALLAVEGGPDPLQHAHLIARLEPPGQVFAHLAGPARLSGPTNGTAIPWSASTAASSLLSMLTTTIPASFARLHAETRALESAGAITIAMTPCAIISSTSATCRLRSRSSLMPLTISSYSLACSRLVLLRSLGHRREELVGQRLHHQRDARLAGRRRGRCGRSRRGFRGTAAAAGQRDGRGTGSAMRRHEDEPCSWPGSPRSGRRLAGELHQGLEHAAASARGGGSGRCRSLATSP